MNAPVTKGMDVPKVGLVLLREPFPAHQISKLPKPTAKQTQEVKDDFKKGIRCTVCGAWHHKDVVHLDYVGHAALTDRLLECDQAWNWEPVAIAENGTPAIDANGGMWIKLTVCGVTRLGYGHPDGKKGGDAIKEVIGDALRNAAMRFGAALDLWHKGDLHGADDEPEADTAKAKPEEPARDPRKIADGIIKAINDRSTALDLTALVADGTKAATAWDWLELNSKPDAARVKAAFDAKHSAMTAADLGGEEIPY